MHGCLLAIQQATRPEWKLTLCTAALALLLHHDGYAEPGIASISITGNSAVGTQEVLGWLASRADLDYTASIVERDRETIRANYRSRGYYEAIVDSVGLFYSADSSLVDLAFIVSEGPLTIVHSYHCRGNRILSTDELVDRFFLRPGDPFVEPDLEADILHMLEQYEDAGYPLASCSVADLVVREGEEQDSVLIVLDITEGTVVTIDEITVAGNTVTDPDVVVRETRLRMGEVFHPDKNRVIQRRLRRLNIFSSIEEPELYLRGERGGLLIKVREGMSNTFDGVIGYVPAANAGEDGFVTGLVSVTMRNLFGSGRKFSFRWEREDRLSQELGVRYLEPWLFSLPVNLAVGFFQRQQDTTFVRRVIDPKAELMVTEEFSLSLFYVADDVIPRAGNTTHRVFKTSSQLIGGELVYDTRDDPFTTTSGVRYRTDVQYGARTTTDVPEEFQDTVEPSVTVQKYEIDFDLYLTTFFRQVVAFGVHGRELQGSQADEGVMYRFGGSRTVRGYRENQFIGARLAWTNTEYRLLLSRQSFLYGFLDTGYYFKPEDSIRLLPPVENFIYGYGVGIQLDTALGFLGVSYALGEGDTFSTGKIHFGLINEF